MARTSPIEQELKARIRQEREREERLSEDVLWARVEGGDQAGVRAALVYFTDPTLVSALHARILERVERSAVGAESLQKVNLLRLLTYLAIDLGSAVPAWGRLRGLPREALELMIARTLRTLEALEQREAAAQRHLLVDLRAEAAGRAKAEGISRDAELAASEEDLVGTSLCDHARRTIRAIRASGLRAAAAAFQEGRLTTVFGNDYAEFLPLVIWLGGAFATTNPVLVKLAWDIDPAYWNRHVDAVIGTRFSRQKLKEILVEGTGPLAEAVDAVATLVTISVVERNCRLLRPVFLATEGAHGYVSVQVDPSAHDDPARMVAGALAIYQELERRLGGVPNAVIKVPSTAAGLVAARELTSKGIGVTVTLTFSLFQALPFAAALSNGNALVSFIAIMNGRLAFPVRDEMKRARVVGGEEAARWAGVEVARKTCRRLYSPEQDGGLSIDPQKVKVMIASLRIYGDWIPDVTELWGVPLITIFPNVRRAYDTVPRPSPTPTLSRSTPAEDLRVLLESEIFRQAWWTQADGALGRPERPLTLGDVDSAAVSRWAPVHETLAQFIGIFDEMREMVKARMTALS